MSLVVRAAVITDPGLVRTNNEDAAYAGRQLFAVADGIGGLPAGEVASEIAIRGLTALDEQFHGAEPLRALRKAVNEANDEIRRVAESDPANDGMGTTVTALLLSGDRFGLLHIGDSRAYLLRDGVLSQLTRDDTYVQALVDQGLLTAEAARNHSQRSLVTRAVHGEHIAPTRGRPDWQIGRHLIEMKRGSEAGIHAGKVALGRYRAAQIANGIRPGRGYLLTYPEKAGQWWRWRIRRVH